VAGNRDDKPADPTVAPERAAYAAAVRLLARRPRTEREVRRWLEQRSYSAAVVDTVLARLGARGYVDDAELALHFIVVRAQRLGHGPRRLIHELERRGVERSTAEQAWEQAKEQGQVELRELLRRQLRRRVGTSRDRLDRSAYRRVYNALLRAGFESSAIKAELDAMRSAPELADDDDTDGSQR
jgi:regulatory protein